MSEASVFYFVFNSGDPLNKLRLTVCKEGSHIMENIAAKWYNETKEINKSVSAVTGGL
jgi:hypothetical protein